MNQTILFTPIGGTDPISQKNCREGSMLHICRIYKPDKVIMYMSKEVLEFQEQDDRYRYCLDRLAQMQNRKMEYEIIERRDLVEVHEFDYFYEDFRTVLEEIYKDMDETDTLLLNVSSGTPAMKSSLLVLQTLGEFPAKVIQVATPEKKMNEHIHGGYDVEILWELNEDNQEPFENRCKEIRCPTLSKIKKEEIIKKHIQVYDYRAALEVAETLAEDETKLYKDLLFMAYRRVMMDLKGVNKMIQKTGVQCLPMRSSSDIKYFEYALSVDIRLKRGEYADFIRAITPLIVDLFELIVKKQCNINMDDYCDLKYRNGNKVREWSIRKLEGTEMKKLLDQEFREFKGGNIYSVHLQKLIAGFSEDKHLVELTENIRNVEGSIRNLAAHQIVSVTDESIRELTGFSAVKIMNMIKELFNYTGMTVKPEFWNSYDELNQVIIERMNG